LSAEQKYDLFVRMLSGQLSQADAAGEASVDRSTISNLRKTARDGAVAALSVKPGRSKQSTAERIELAELRAEVRRLQETIIEQAIELAALRGKASWG
jgi:transposase-like protein